MYLNTNLIPDDIPAQIDPDPYQGGSLIFATAQPEKPKPLKLTATFMMAADVDSFLDLQKEVRLKLKEDYHLKERNEDDLHLHLSERMPLIGVKTEDGKHVGQLLLSFLKNHDAVQNLDGYPIQKGLMGVTAVVQSLCVHPDYQGKGISRLLLTTAFDTAAQNGMTQIYSAIADDNLDSINSFKARGYEPVGNGIDGVKGYEKTYYRKLTECNASRQGVALEANIA